MKVPKDKLPLKLGHRPVYGQYGITCKHPAPTKVQDSKFAGRIAYKDLSHYVVKATNNFHKAVDLLELCLERLEINNIEKSEQPFINEIEQFLKTLEDGC